MAWIKVDQTLLGHEKTFRLSEELKMPEVNVMGYVIALWCWALDHYTDGVLPESDKRIAHACQWEGAPEPFVCALISAGFLDINRAGNRAIHNWDLYAGALIRTREANKKRAKKHREKSP